VYDDCDSNLFVCDPGLCGNGDKCVCEYEEVVVEPCKETKPCFAKDGNCVKKEDCKLPFICDPDLCDEADGCVCKYKEDVVEPCEQTEICFSKSGECVKKEDCESPFICDPDLCFETKGCVCKYEKDVVEPCKPTKSCTKKSGECVKKEDCKFPFTCDSTLCFESEGCTCKIAPPLPCLPSPGTDNKCIKANGECVQDCVEVDGVRFCYDDLCSSSDAAAVDDDCSCKIERCPDENDACQKRGGVCKVYDDCDSNLFVCDPGLCGNGDKCVCEYEDVVVEPCEQTDDCTKNSGECVKKDDCKFPFICDPDLCDEAEGCVCRIAKPLPCELTKECYASGGECVKDCVEVDGVICKEGACGTTDDWHNDCFCKISKGKF